MKTKAIFDEVAELKSCSRCSEMKPFADFHKNPNGKFGLSQICKICDRQRRNENYYKNLDRERARARTLSAKKLARKKIKGICNFCQKPIAVYSTVFCVEHWFKRLAKSRTESYSNGLALHVLLWQQNYECAYTGLPLSIGINAQIDHKDPIMLGGENIMSNFQWVDASINLMKGKRTHKEFIELCSHITERHIKNGN